MNKDIVKSQQSLISSDVPLMKSELGKYSRNKQFISASNILINSI